MIENPRYRRERSVSAERSRGLHEFDGLTPDGSEIPHFARVVHDRDSARKGATEPHRRNQAAISGRQEALDGRLASTRTAPHGSDVRTEAYEHLLCVRTKREDAAGPEHFDLVVQEVAAPLPVDTVVTKGTNVATTVVLEAHESVREEAAMRGNTGVGEKPHQIAPRRAAQVFHSTLRRVLHRRNITEVVPQEHEWPLGQRLARSIRVPQAVSTWKEGGAGDSAAFVDRADTGGILPKLPQSLDEEPNRMIRAEGLHQGRVRDWPLVGCPLDPPLPSHLRSADWLVMLGKSVANSCSTTTISVHCVHGRTSGRDPSGG